MRRLPALLLLAVPLSSVGAACSDDESNSVCDDREQLEEAVDSLQTVDPVADGADEVRARFDDVEAALGDLRDSAGNELAEQLDLLSLSVDGLRESVDGADTPQAKLAAIQTGLDDVRGNLENLAEAVAPDC